MANGFGLYDMIGNVAELCGDWYEYDYYATSPTENPKGPTASGKRVIRGGDHTDEDAWYLRTAARGWAYPHYRYQAIGFRLVAAH
jgi:formylglycine-generating enzyme required for sulfatase activity